MLIAGFPAGPWGTNCYVAATGPGTECVVIDPGKDAAPGVAEVVAEHRLKPVAVLVTLYSNPLTIVPLYYLAFRLGQFALLENDGSLPPLAFGLEGKGFREWLPAALDWLTSVGKSLIIGLPLLAVVLAVTGYCLVDWTWRLYVRCAWQARRRARARRSSQP